MVPLILLLLAVSSLAQDHTPLPIHGLLEVPGLIQPTPQPTEDQPYLNQLGLKLDVYDTPSLQAKKQTITQTNQLDLREYAYDTPCLVILEKSGEKSALWLKIKLKSGHAWLLPPKSSKEHSLFQILSKSIAYLTPQAARNLSTTPGAPATKSIPKPKDPQDSNILVVLAEKTINGKQWFQVQALSDSPCEVSKPKVSATGWLPALSPTGAVNVWFYSRGC